MPRVKKKSQAHDVLQKDSYSKYNLNDIIESSTNKNDLLKALKTLVDSVRKENKTGFYPETGTAFCDKSIHPPRVFIVESKHSLSVTCQSDNSVAFFCAESGCGDFSNWVDSVKDESIEVIWCPVHGRIANNQDYIQKWNL
jgi:hypothetical protein